MPYCWPLLRRKMFFSFLFQELFLLLHRQILLKTSLYFHYLVVMVQAASDTRFTKTTWKQLCAIRAIIMALQLKADPSSVRWQLTPGWWLPFRWKIRFPATEWVSEWVSGPSALLLHRQGYYNTRAHLLHCYNQHCTTQTRLLHRDTVHCSVPRCFHPQHHCTEDF